MPVLYCPDNSDFQIPAILVDRNDIIARIEVRGEWMDVPIKEIRPILTE